MVNHCARCGKETQAFKIDDEWYCGHCYNEIKEETKRRKQKPTNFMQSDTWENFWEAGGKHKDDSMGGVF